MEGMDWASCGLKDVDEDANILTSDAAKEIVRAMTRQEIDDLMDSFPRFGWVNNKLYKTSVVSGNNIQFILTSNMHEDRTFNLEFLQYANSLVLLPTATYNYVLNPNSITHQKHIPARKFLNTAMEWDKFVGSEKLGRKGSLYTADFYIKFIMRALLCAVGYPSKELLPDGRMKILRDVVKAAWNSNVRRKYPLKTLKWGFKHFNYYLRKAIRR